MPIFLLCSPVWLAVIFLKKRSEILQESVKRRQFLTSATTTVIYIFIYSTGYHLVLEPSQAGKRGENMYRDSTVRQLSHSE